MLRTSSLSPNTYRSHADLWLTLILFGACVSVFAGAGVMWMERGPLAASGLILTALAVSGFIAWIRLTTSYTVDSRELAIRSGPFRWRIPISEIRSIEPARGLMALRSGPALSIQRLVVTYGGGRQLMISPEDQQRFMADVRARQ